MIVRDQFGVRLKSQRADRQRQRSGERGYAYLLAMMMVMAMMIASLAALQKGLAQAKRNQEALVIWRGEQYVRAIRSFYKKTNRYPRDMEELQKGIPGIHFLRPSAFKNPMNPSDGAWRMVYVNPAGQLIGSTRYANLQQMALIVLNNGQMPKNVTGIPGLTTSSPFGGQPALGINGGAANGANSNNPNGQPGVNTGANGQNNQGGANNGANGATGGGNNGDNQSGGNANGDNGNENQGTGTEEGEEPVDTSGNQTPPQTNQTNSGNSVTAPQLGNPGTNQPNQGFLGSSTGLGGDQPVNPLLTMKPTGPVSGPVVGGFLTGVALTQEVKSQKVYQGGKKYIEWEFIWNPMIDQARALASGQGQGATGALGPNGLNGNGVNGQNGQNGNNGFGFGGILGGQQPGQQPNQQPNQQPQPPQQQDPNQPQQPQQ
jgi:hypothetical protein